MKSFIWTECLGCPEIGSVAINSFLLTHHNLTLNVFVYADDLPYLPKHNRIVYHTFFDSSKFLFFALKVQSRFSKVFQPSESLFRSYFKKGHKGTSLLWAYILKKYSFCDTLIHFDSDVVFIDNAIDRLLSLSDEYDFIGQCRPYKNNPNNDFVRSYPDLVQTCCFLFSHLLFLHSIVSPSVILLWLFRVEIKLLATLCWIFLISCPMKHFPVVLDFILWMLKTSAGFLLMVLEKVIFQVLMIIQQSIRLMLVVI